MVANEYKLTKKNYILFAICMAFVFYFNSIIADFLIWKLDPWWLVIAIGVIGIISSIFYNTSRFMYFITFSLVLWLIYIFMRDIFPKILIFVKLL